MLQPFTTVAAAADAVRRIRSARTELGLDAAIRICLPVISACDLDEAQTVAITKARLVTYVQMPDNAKIYANQNHWDPEVMRRVQEHELFRDLSRANADQVFHREQLLGPAALIPDQWIEESCAMGSPAECVATLQRYRDVGIDEFALYGTTPAQNASLVAAWRAHSDIANRRVPTPVTVSAPAAEGSAEP